MSIIEGKVELVTTLSFEKILWNVKRNIFDIIDNYHDIVFCFMCLSSIMKKKNEVKYLMKSILIHSYSQSLTWFNHKTIPSQVFYLFYFIYFNIKKSSINISIHVLLMCLV